MLYNVSGRQIELFGRTIGNVLNAEFQCLVADGAGFLYRDPIRAKKESWRRLNRNHRGRCKVLRHGEVESSTAICNAPIPKVTYDGFGIAHEHSSIAEDK